MINVSKKNASGNSPFEEMNHQMQSTQLFSRYFFEVFASSLLKEKNLLFNLWKILEIKQEMPIENYKIF